MIKKLLSEIKKHCSYKIDISVSKDFFECSTSFGGSLKIETYLFIDESQVVRAIGNSTDISSNWRRLDVFGETANFIIANNILKYVLSQIDKEYLKIVRPLVYFYGVKEIDEICFYHRDESDRFKVRLRFFEELGLSIGGREVFFVEKA